MLKHSLAWGALLLLLCFSQEAFASSRHPRSACPPAPHIAFLYWIASTSPNVAGYRMYRSTVQGKNYTRLNTSPVTGTFFRDSGTVSGKTYYYVATTVSSSGAQ